MGKRKSGRTKSGARELNPTDAQRKIERLREKKRNARDRARVREASSLKKNPQALKQQLDNLRAKAMHGALEPKEGLRLKQLEAAWKDLVLRVQMECAELGSDHTADAASPTKYGSDSDDIGSESDDSDADEAPEPTARPTQPEAAATHVYKSNFSSIAPEPQQQPQIAEPAVKFPPLPPGPPPLPPGLPPRGAAMAQPAIASSASRGPLMQPPLGPVVPVPGIAGSGWGLPAQQRTAEAAEEASRPHGNFSGAQPAEAAPEPIEEPQAEALPLTAIQAQSIVHEPPPEMPPPAPIGRMFVPTQLRVQRKPAPAPPANSLHQVTARSTGLHSGPAVSQKETPAHEALRSGSSAKLRNEKELDEAFLEFLAEVGDLAGDSVQQLKS